MKKKLTKQDYQDWGKNICPCLNPYCNPSEAAICNDGKPLTKGIHKKGIEEIEVVR